MKQKIRHFFEFTDRFDFPISFRYKREDSFSTCFGGIISFLLILITMGFFIYYFIPFCKRENYSLFYYTINLNKTEEINLKKSKAALAFNFDCKLENKLANYGNLGVKDFLELDAKYINYPNETNPVKETLHIDIDNCTNSDLYNDQKLIKTVGGNLSNLYCLKDLGHEIKNRRQDKKENFAYYQIDVIAKNNTNYSLARKFLFDNDCKLELYYIDVEIDVKDYKDPVKPFLNKVFVQLNPDFEIKMDTFFMNEYFESVNDLFFQTKGKNRTNNLFSRTEEYFLYKGINSNKEFFAKIYIRADTRKMEIKRKYQTVMEFVADTFSFWEDIFIICKIILTLYNRTSLNYFIESELFFFKGENNKSFNISSHIEKIKTLIKTIDNRLQNEFRNTLKNKIIEFNDNQKNNNNLSEGTETKDEFIPDKKIKKAKTEIKDKKDKTDNTDNTDNTNKTDKKDNFKVQKYIFKKSRYILIKLLNDFRCKCCKCKASSREIQILNAENIINKKLDIIHYLKNLLLFEVFNAQINGCKKEFFKLLSIPIITSEPDKEEEDEEFFQYVDKHFTESDFKALNEKIEKLKEKPKIGDNDINLLSSTSNHLKHIIDKNLYFN